MVGSSDRCGCSITTPTDVFGRSNILEFCLPLEGMAFGLKGTGANAGLLIAIGPYVGTFDGKGWSEVQ